jgi:5,5'-dehydrodivanillate O-demethylase oxygenase subunit
MLTQDQNDRLTRVGRDTPMGKYLRCFWHPVAAAVQLKDEPVLPVKLLGESLALFRAEDGTLGLVQDRCPHRGASLACGMIEGSGLRCAYHAWKYDKTGQCVDQPAEPAHSRYKDEIKITAYPVEELGGLIWAYLGPQPAPLLPRFDFLARPEYDHDVGISKMPCNWLQVAENNMDPLHIEYLHMMYTNYIHRRKGLPPVMTRKHKKIGFDVFEFGIIKRRQWEGEPETEEWTVGHPQLFPGTAVVAYNATWVQAQIRVPVDDTNTIVYWYNAKQREPGRPPRGETPLWNNPYLTPDGEYAKDSLNGQDMMVMITQGGIADRTQEHLGTSDQGVVLYRKTLLAQIERMERGEDPLGVVRDRAKNEPWIELPIEKHLGYSFQGAKSTFTYDMPATGAAEQQPVGAK